MSNGTMPMPAWAKDIDEENMKKAVQKGDIYPRLPLPEVGEEIEVVFLEEPREITGEGLPEGPNFAANVLHKGTPRNLITPKSVRFGLLKAMRLHNLTTVKGKAFTVGAQIAEVAAAVAKGKHDSKVYYVLYRPSRDVPVAKAAAGGEVTEL